MQQRDWMTPVHTAYCADPFVLAVDGIYYAFGTADRDITPLSARGGRQFTLLRSTDFKHWELLGGALESPAAFGPHADYWAPEVACGEDGLFYLYYSVGEAGEIKHRLRVAISERPEGPYMDTGVTLVTQAGIPFAIDPHPFRDPTDGAWYLFYSRDFLDVTENGRSGTGLVVDRMLSMTELAGEERPILRANHDWQRFQQNRPMPHYGPDPFDWHTLEGAFVVPHSGRYYLLYSGAAYGTHAYGVDFAVADHPLGPWDGRGGEVGPRVLFTLPNKLRGPGHNSVFTGPEGREYIAFHAWDTAGQARQMHLCPLIWTEDGPKAAVMLNFD